MVGRRGGWLVVVVIVLAGAAGWVELMGSKFWTAAYEVYFFRELRDFRV